MIRWLVDWILKKRKSNSDDCTFYREFYFNTVKERVDVVDVSEDVVLRKSRKRRKGRKGKVSVSVSEDVSEVVDVVRF